MPLAIHAQREAAERMMGGEKEKTDVKGRLIYLECISKNARLIHCL